MENSFSHKVQRRLFWPLSFDKNNLGEESFALGKEIHRDKRKMSIKTIAESLFRKEL